MVAPIQLPLSRIGDPESFAAELEAHRAALEAHRVGKVGVPVPVHPFDHLIARVPQSGPVATRGPDTFTVLPYTIVDDTPPPPTLEQRKALLTGQLNTARQATIDALLSPARTNLLNLDMADALSVPEPNRTPAQVGAIAAYTAHQSRVTDIMRNAAEAALEIEELTVANVDSWKVPAL